MIIVTGAAGFIGSNFVKYLNDKGIYNILIVDDMTDVAKTKNLSKLIFNAYMDKDDFKKIILNESYFEIVKNWNVEKVFHFGAISSTTHANGKELIEENYSFTVELLNLFANRLNIPVFYASSASVYGNSSKELDPLNCYALSKKMVDDYLMNKRYSFNAYGLRFFNVFGPGESHKQGQASPIFQFRKQVKQDGSIKLFNVRSRRDFVPVSYVCEAVWQIACEASSCDLERRIFDIGVGKQLTFTEIATMISERYGASIEIVDFPQHLRGKYQFDTIADLSHVEKIGNLSEVVGKIDIRQEVKNYLDLMDREDSNDIIIGLGPE